jgi:hypothetical protein
LDISSLAICRNYRTDLLFYVNAILLRNNLKTD